MRVKLHPFQSKAYKSKKKIIVCSAGKQSGKTHVGTFWMGKQMMTYTDKEDNFIVVAPTYKILKQAALPKFLNVFDIDWGTYKAGDAEFKVHGGGTVYLRSLDNINSLEGIPNVRAIWADEAGMLSLLAWENIEGRAARLNAQILCTTTPYSLNWLYKMWEEWTKGKRPDVEFIQWASNQSPYFPDAEYERQKTLMDPRRFAMAFQGQFGKMHGLVYEDINLCQSKTLPQGTRYYAGVDWGYSNPFVVVVRAITPEGHHYRVAEYYKSGLFIDQIIDICRQRKAMYNIELFICDPSDPRAIEELNRSGLKAIGGNNDMRKGLDKMSEMIRTNRFTIFEDMNSLGIDEYNTYHYPDPKELKIDDDAKDQMPVKQNDHGCFVAGTLVDGRPIETIKVGDYVNTPIGPRKVLNSGCTGVKKVINISFSDGSNLTGTGDHPVFTRKGIRRLDSLTRSDTLQGWNKSHSTTKNIIGMGAIGMRVVAGSAYIGLSGFSIMVKSLKTIISTIRTLISTTILLRILNFSKKMSTLRCTQSSIAKTNILLSLKKKILIRSGLLLKLGMALKKGSIGIKSTTRIALALLTLLLKRVDIAIENLKLLAGKPSSVRAIVSLMIAGKEALITFQGHVLSVMKNLRRENIQEQKRVLGIARVSYLEKPCPVYNLTVEDAGCYYANGVLVSNCDADRYVTVFIEQAAKKEGSIFTPHDQSQGPSEVNARLEWLRKGGSSRYNAH